MTSTPSQSSPLYSLPNHLAIAVPIMREEVPDLILVSGTPKRQSQKKQAENDDNVSEEDSFLRSTSLPRQVHIVSPDASPSNDPYSANTLSREVCHSPLSLDPNLVEFPDLERHSADDTLLRIDCNGRPWFVPVCLMMDREREMRHTAAEFNIPPERWTCSWLFAQWKSKAKIVLNVDWEPWLWTCLRGYYNTGTLRIPNDCQGSDLLLALETCKIVYHPQQLLFAHYDIYTRVKLWSDYYTLRNMLLDWIQAHNNNNHETVRYCTLPEAPHPSRTILSPPNAQILCPDYAPLLHSLFCDSPQVQTQLRRALVEDLLQGLEPDSWNIKFELASVTVSQNNRLWTLENCGVLQITPKLAEPVLAPTPTSVPFDEARGTNLQPPIRKNAPISVVHTRSDVQSVTSALTFWNDDITLATAETVAAPPDDSWDWLGHLCEAVVPGSSEQPTTAPTAWTKLVPQPVQDVTHTWLRHAFNLTHCANEAPVDTTTQKKLPPRRSSRQRRPQTPSTRPLPTKLPTRVFQRLKEQELKTALRHQVQERQHRRHGSGGGIEVRNLEIPEDILEEPEEESTPSACVTHSSSESGQLEFSSTAASRADSSSKYHKRGTGLKNFLGLRRKKTA